MGNLQFGSSSFSDDGEIPRECGYKNGNEQPPLVIWGIPDEAKSLALIMDDPDAMEAVGKVWVHWVVWNLTWFADGKPDWSRPTKQGMTDFGEVGYGGPAPPDKRHTYIFKLYALDTKLDLPDKSTKADVEKAMEGHIMDQATLKGTYAP
jgi:hypothetical protein